MRTPVPKCIECIQCIETTFNFAAVLFFPGAPAPGATRMSTATLQSTFPQRRTTNFNFLHNYALRGGPGPKDVLMPQKLSRSAPLRRVTSLHPPRWTLLPLPCPQRHGIPFLIFLLLFSVTLFCYSFLLLFSDTVSAIIHSINLPTTSRYTVSDFSVLSKGHTMSFALRPQLTPIKILLQIEQVLYIE